MSLFNKPAKTIKKVIAEYSDFDDDDIPPEVIESRAMEEPWNDGDQTPPRRKVGRNVADREYDEVFGDDGDDDALQPRKPPSIPVVQSKNKETIRVSADINRELHIRLKIYSFRTGQSIIQIIEDWITKHTPA